MRLTDDQLVLLAGHEADDKQRAEVSAAAERLALMPQLLADDRLPGDREAAASLAAWIVVDARQQGRVGRRSTTMSRCAACLAVPEPIRFKSGRRKGEIKDYGSLHGYDYPERFVTVRGIPTAGVCHGCARDFDAVLRDLFRVERVQVPDLLRSEGRPRWRKRDLVECMACSWAGHEGELETVPALMDGVYRGKCPSCGEARRPFGAEKFNRPGGFVVAETKLGECEICDSGTEPDQARCRRHRGKS